jgi:hypothetical protein
MASAENIKSRWGLVGLWLAGVLVGMIGAILFHSGNKYDEEFHWSKIREYQALVRDSSSYKHDPATGMRIIQEPLDPLPHLAELVHRGKVYHFDIVLPSVYPNPTTNSHWLRYVYEHENILYSLGNGSNVFITPKGEQPLHLNLWCVRGHEDEVAQLVRELESIADRGPALKSLSGQK